MSLLPKPFLGNPQTSSYEPKTFHALRFCPIQSHYFPIRGSSPRHPSNHHGLVLRWHLLLHISLIVIFCLHRLVMYCVNVVFLFGYCSDNILLYMYTRVLCAVQLSSYQLPVFLSITSKFYCVLQGCGNYTQQTSTHTF